MSTTLPATPSDLTVDAVYLRPSPMPVFSPEETTPLPVVREAVTADDDCPECDNTGRPFAGYYGGVTRFHDGCSACGREGGE